MRSIEKPRKFERSGYEKTRLLLRLFRSNRKHPRNIPSPAQKKTKVAFIHGEKPRSAIRTGATQINRLMVEALAQKGVSVRNFYPRIKLVDTPNHIKGIANILFFYSLLEHKNEILRYDVIQGTTYTPLPFLTFDVPVVCHFGSTARGFLESTPRTSDLPPDERTVYKELVRLGVIPEFDFKTLRPIEDVADIEAVAALRASACVATSAKVREELLQMGVAPERIKLIHNAIEDYWFEPPREAAIREPHLVFLGRLGNDVFTLKLKGFSRLVNFYSAFPDTPKTTVCMTTNRKLKEWMRVAFPQHYMYVNLRKDLIPGALSAHYGSILFLSSRYEGFSLSLVEGMSQGLIPVAFPVGVAPEIIRDGENGFLVTSVEEAIERVRPLLADQERRLAMAAAAQKTTLQFKAVRIAEELERLYLDLKKERKSKNSSALSEDLWLS